MNKDDKQARAPTSRDVTSNAHNAALLDQIRRNNCLKLSIVSRDVAAYNYNIRFTADDGDDMDWLGYFIGRCTSLRNLCISGEESGRDRDALMRGVNSNKSVEVFELYDHLDFDVRLLDNFCANNPKLESLTLDGNDIGDSGVVTLMKSLANHPQLNNLSLGSNNIGRVGCVALSSMQSCTSGCGWVVPCLVQLDLSYNRIDDTGLEALASSLASSTTLKRLNLSSNTFITSSGLRSLSALLHSENYRLEDLHLESMPIGDDGAHALAAGLTGNVSVKRLMFSSDVAGITELGWSSFSRLLCDTSSINSIHKSNHTLNQIGSSPVPRGHDLRHYLKLNTSSNLHRTAQTKILMHNLDLDIEPFCVYNLKFLPLLVHWFESGTFCRNHLKSKESLRTFRSRKLSVVYKFVRSMPMLVADAHWNRMLGLVHLKKKMICEKKDIIHEKKRKLDLELQKLNEDAQRLREDEMSLLKRVRH
eukprot:CAMPEP_0113402286 /NCGR_PEP_ID=MMETSP0013_2-20120614/17174_1 /TAXON_ID=2843 ORGANISM="Skeletonema costatum, Strain 1716" /NCGR_SAMPLE_ID=MMETSP0013_2 /ASSEMBLY_ACC=CAM_ASM_000158 /LENGTH=475 /DNA_ID=CAMNT_0000287609 /DNA_START=65 /DNA_END=1492 /DNA_ORIENTATION=+ /assembly_acc=CAM_ASM_000158